MQVEFLLARDNQTWTTEVFELPDDLDEAPSSVLEEWWLDKYDGKPEYEGVAGVWVYSR